MAPEVHNNVIAPIGAVTAGNSATQRDASDGCLCKLIDVGPRSDDGFIIQQNAIFKIISIVLLTCGIKNKFLPCHKQNLKASDR